MLCEPSSLPLCRKICPNTPSNESYLSASMAHLSKTSFTVWLRLRGTQLEDRSQVRNRRDPGHRRVGGTEAFCAALRGSTGADRRYCRFQSLSNRWTDAGNPSEANNEWRVADVSRRLEDRNIDRRYLRDPHQSVLSFSSGFGWT